MTRSKLMSKLLILSAVILLVPVITTAYFYQANMIEVETSTVQRMFRERYASYDRVFDFVEVTFDPEMGVEYTSRGIQQLLDTYGARLQIIRADGLMLYDSEEPGTERTQVDLNYELKLMSERADLFSTRNKYMRPVRQPVAGQELNFDQAEEVVAYALITDDNRVLEQNLYEDMRGYYINPYYYGFLSFLLVLMVAWVLLYREILRPIRDLRRSTRAISRGNLDFQIQCNTDNEIGDLCEDFAAMKGSLTKSIQARLEEKDRNRMYVKSIEEDLREPIGRLQALEDAAQTVQMADLAGIRGELTSLLEELSRFTDHDLSRFVLQREMVSIYRFFEILRERRISNHTDRENVEIAEPGENSMLYLDIRRMIKMLDNIIIRMDGYTQGAVPIRVDSASDVLEYDMLLIKVYWQQAGVLEGSSLEEILEAAYARETEPNKHDLVAALVMAREILDDSRGDLELLAGDEQTGFILRIPRYTPDIS